MDTDLLLNEICKRVQEKLMAVEKNELPSLLILTQEHGTLCHETLENSELCKCYNMECALLKEYQCNLKDYEAVIVYTLSNEALGKVVHGIFDNGFTRLFGQALLEGKKIFISQEGVELYQYKKTAPRAIYESLERNLKILLDSGVVIAPHQQIPEQILYGKFETQVAVPELESVVLDKKIITEKDLIPLGHKRIRQVTIREKSILSDLAKEYAAKHNITIKRSEISSGKRE